MWAPITPTPTDPVRTRRTANRLAKIYMALITGDSLHHPVQMPSPDIASCVDIDPVQAETTRRALLASLAGTDTLLLGTHFPPPTGGYVRSRGDVHHLVPVPPDDRP
jgi:glyoxylase-like metal-dependent hydrolase (beta-lactamase superfamily II)